MLGWLCFYSVKFMVRFQLAFQAVAVIYNKWSSLKFPLCDGLSEYNHFCYLTVSLSGNSKGIDFPGYAMKSQLKQLLEWKSALLNMDSLAFAGRLTVLQYLFHGSTLRVISYNNTLIWASSTMTDQYIASKADLRVTVSWLSCFSVASLSWTADLTSCVDQKFYCRIDWRFPVVFITF